MEKKDRKNLGGHNSDIFTSNPSYRLYLHGDQWIQTVVVVIATDM